LSQFVQAVEDLCLLAERVEPSGEPPPCRDEHDRMYLHCAVAAGVDYLITWDDDLLSLEAVNGIPIVTPGELVRNLGLGRGGHDD
jgi:predicted nucleic acid-binding protein